MAKILLVDDDLDLTTVFATVLKKEGFEIITAADAKAGIEKVRSENPALILLDQVLPDMAGNDMLKMLKDDPQTKNIPVAMLSNFGQNDLIQTAINYGALDYIIKYQIEPTDLVNKVQNLLKESQSSQAPIG